MTSHDQAEPITLEMMRTDIARIIDLEPHEVRDDDSLIDLGLDSMRMLSLVVKWSETGIPIEFADLAEFVTLGQWWQVVERLQAQRQESDRIP